MSTADVDEDAPTTVFLRPATSMPKRPRPTRSDGLWDANDVAEYLKVSRSWVYHRAESGQLPHVRVGGLLRFDPTTIRAATRGEDAAVKTVVAFAKRTKR